MFVYTVFAAIFSIIAGILIAIRVKKEEHVTYTLLDRMGRITNIILCAAYICLAPIYLFLGMISCPAHDGFLGILGWIVSVVIASAPLFCGLGLGVSVALRKKGRSRASFIAQFAGVLGIGLTVLLYSVFVGNLLQTLN